MEPMYESEHTKFMRDLFEKNPQLPEKQLVSRAIWWDKKQNITESKQLEESNMPMKPYVYFGG